MPPQSAWLGTSAHRAADNWDLSTAIGLHENLIGRPLDIVHSYHGPTEASLTSDEKALSTSGRILMVSWKPASTWSDAAGGNATVNARIDAMANSIKSISPKPVMFVVFHEPENDMTTANTTQAYVNM
jgi:hypothetical protein